MGVVILGHGGMNPSDAAKTEICALSPGTILQFYADTGQSLQVNRDLLSRFGELQAPFAPLDDSGVTYNFGLEPLTDDQRTRLVADDADWGGHTLVLVGTQTGLPMLCSGDATTCPTDPRTVSGEIAGPRAHTCNGILKNYAGQEIHWVACTGIEGFDAETQGVVSTAMGDAPSGVRIGEDPDDAVGNALAYLERNPDGFPAWFDALEQRDKDILLQDPGIYTWNQGRGTITEWLPSDADFQSVADVNQPYVKGLEKDEEATWEVGGFLVLLGSGHGYTDWVHAQDDYASGTFQVKRATFGAGSLVFSGVPAVHQGTITSAVGQFSEKDVEFE